jgi:hypothetical protein
MFFPPWLHSPSGPSPHYRGFTISHSDTQHSAGLLWTSDQTVAETSTWRHTTLITDRHPCPRRIRTRNPSRRTAADPRLRPHGHWDRLQLTVKPRNWELFSELIGCRLTYICRPYRELQCRYYAVFTLQLLTYHYNIVCSYSVSITYIL